MSHAAPIQPGSGATPESRGNDANTDGFPRGRQRRSLTNPLLPRLNTSFIAFTDTITTVGDMRLKIDIAGLRVLPGGRACPFRSTRTARRCSSAAADRTAFARRESRPSEASSQAPRDPGFPHGISLVRKPPGPGWADGSTTTVPRRTPPGSCSSSHTTTPAACTRSRDPDRVRSLRGQDVWSCHGKDDQTSDVLLADFRVVTRMGRSGQAKNRSRSLITPMFAVFRRPRKNATHAVEAPERIRQK